MIKLVDEKDCCGCSVCSEICTKKCIHMTQGTLGHLFPAVDEKLCVECGLCKQVCPADNKLKKNEYKKSVYATYSKDKIIRFSGSSGGMFGTFASKVLENGYIVYGAAFDNALNLKCIAAKNKNELLPLMKSKYLQSDIRGKFSEIRASLENGDRVLITATPCQISALKLYLRKDYENLITVDFFCHGVPSQIFFDKCMEYDAKTKYNGEIFSYQFRTKKKNGSTPHYFTVEYKKNRKIKKKTGYYFESTFYAFFQKYICLRESCYDCKFAKSERVSDITISDFHDIDKYVRGINRFDGVSMVVVNSEKGEQLLKDCKDTLYLEKLEQIQGTPEGSKRPKNRDEFVNDYEVLSIEDLANKYIPKKRYLKMRIYYTLPKVIRNKLKKLVGGRDAI